MLIRDHTVEDYAALLEMDATDVGILADDDHACLRELGEYLVTTAASQRYAVWLPCQVDSPICPLRYGECSSRQVICCRIPSGVCASAVSRSPSTANFRR